MAAQEHGPLGPPSCGPQRRAPPSSPARSYAKGFAAMGALFAGSECLIESYRAKHDARNSIYAGCTTGAILAHSGGPKAMCIGKPGPGCMLLAACQAVNAPMPAGDGCEVDMYPDGRFCCPTALQAAPHLPLSRHSSTALWVRPAAAAALCWRDSLACRAAPAACAGWAHSRRCSPLTYAPCTRPPRTAGH